MSAWADLAASYRPFGEDELVDLRESWPEQLASAVEADRAAAFEGMPDTLARRIALVGPAGALEGIDAIVPAMTAVIDRMDPEPEPPDRGYAVTLLSMVNALRCCGLRDDETTADTARERRWLTAAAREPDAQSGVGRGRDHLALAAAGAGMNDLVARVAGGQDQPFDPGAMHGCDLAQFAGQLAGAASAGAGRDGVAAAWDSFRRDFPGEVEAQGVQWLDLLWAARGVYVVLGGLPVGEVAAELHRDVRG